MSTLKLQTKIFYGIGQLGEGIKNSSFEVFLLFYYNQVLGLSGTLAGAATFAALVIDAFFDPLAGSLSDSLRSRWGRRHPFMYAGAVPFGAMFYFLFAPPEGLGQTGLFLWLTTFAVLVRMAMAIYLIPHNALGAELSDDYHERTAIGSWRLLFGFLGGVGTSVIGFSYFFKDSPDHPLGQRNAESYPEFALFFAVIASVAVLWSALGTHSRIHHLVPVSHEPEPLSFGRLFRELSDSLQSASFRALFAGTLVYFVTRGVQQALGLHLAVHFWELGSAENTQLALAAAGGLVVGLPFWTVASRRLDKKPSFMIGVTVFSLFVVAGPVLKLLGFWPSREDHSLFMALLAGFGFLGTFGAAASLVTATSMMADLTDEHEHDTGRRQEGIFFGALAFSGKASSGLGHLIAGVALDLIAFPINADRGTVPPDVVRLLAIIYGPGTILVLIVGVLYFARYELTKDRVHEIQKVLEQRRTAAR